MDEELRSESRIQFGRGLDANELEALFIHIGQEIRCPVIYKITPTKRFDGDQVKIDVDGKDKNSIKPVTVYLDATGSIPATSRAHLYGTGLKNFRCFREMNGDPDRLYGLRFIATSETDDLANEMRLWEDVTKAIWAYVSSLPQT